MSTSDAPAGAGDPPGLLDGWEGMCLVELVDVRVELPDTHAVVTLRERAEPGRALSFPIGQHEGVALALARRRVPTRRPLTHELLCATLDAFGVAIAAVRITGTEAGNYRAELVLVREGSRRNLPCRPSDALVVAARQSLPVPILVAEGLLSA